MPNNNSHGSPYKMKAGKMGPMQKNFGSELAINKKLDKKSMEGGMTGQPGNTLDGPLAKKSPMYARGKNAVKPTNKTATTKKVGASRDSMLSDTNNDGNMITRGFAKAKANRKAATAKRAAKKARPTSLTPKFKKIDTKLTRKPVTLSGNKVKKNKLAITNPKPKPTKKTGYENATSVNAMVTQRTKFRADAKNKGKKYPGQAEINKRLKKDPKKFD